MTSVIDRRTFISSLTLTILAAPLAAEAQSAGKIYRIPPPLTAGPKTGNISATTPPRRSPPSRSGATEGGARCRERVASPTSTVRAR